MFVIDDVWIFDLKTSQQNVLSGVDQCLVNVRSFKNNRNQLIRLQDLLLKHFTLQKKVLYDVLFDRYGDDRETRKLVEFLFEDLKCFKIDAITFFDYCDLGSMGKQPVNFPNMMTQFAHTVRGRIHVEQERLNPLVDNYEQNES